MSHRPVVYDVNVLVDALVNHTSDLYTWPVLPPRSDNPSADCIGVVNDDQDFTLWLSPHILDNTRRVLIEKYGVKPPEADEYVELLEQIAVASGGEVVEPERTVHACRDHEDNLILDLAAHAGAIIVVSNDTDLTSMSPWRGTPVLQPHQFSANVDAMRRAQHGKPSKRSTTDRLRDQSARRAVSRKDDPDPFSAEHDPDEFDRQRERFDKSRSRLMKVIESWNPHNPSLRKKIERWERNLEVVDGRISDIDDLAPVKPEAASTLLLTLNQQLDTALEHLVPPASAVRRESRSGWRPEPPRPETAPDDEPEPGG